MPEAARPKRPMEITLALDDGAGGAVGGDKPVGAAIGPSGGGTAGLDGLRMGSGGPPGRPIGGAPPTGAAPIETGRAVPAVRGLPVRSEAGPPAGGRPVEGEPEFGFPGASIEAPGLYQGTSPVGGPATLFNRGGAPIAILGGVFGGGLPIGGPVTQIFRSGAPVPNTLYIVTLEPSGPIGEFLLPTGGGPIGPLPRPGAGAVPFGRFFGEAGQPIFAEVPNPGIGQPIGGPTQGGLML